MKKKRNIRKILKAFCITILMARYFWILFGLTALVALFELTGPKSLEITIFLFSMNFMVLAVEMWGNKINMAGIIAKIENLEMALNDIASQLISSSLVKKRQEIIEWLNKF
jgi:hypothetical protein